MKICHVSDTHGTFPPLPECDIIIHSGDLLPNSPFRGCDSEHKYQDNWVNHRRDKFKKWIGNKPFLYCCGNHDYISVGKILRRSDFNINAISLNHRLVNFNGLNFFGLPFIPFDRGHWNYEATIPEMNAAIEKMEVYIKEATLPDASLNWVLVCHCPPAGILDVDRGISWGNTSLSNWLTFAEKELLPKAVLCGHVHGGHGSLEQDGITYVNSATIINLIEVDETGNVLSIER